MSENKRRLSVPKWVGRNQALVLGISFLLFLVIIMGIKTLHARAVESRKAVLRTSYSRILNSFAAMPSPSKMKPGIVNSETSQVIRNSSEQATEVEKISKETNCKFTQYFVLPSHCFHIASDTTYVSRSFKEYATVLSSLQAFLEYNPKIDTLNYSPGATQTVERMNKLRDGLANSKQELGRFNVSTVRDDLVKIIESAQESQVRLEQTGETDPFVMLYEQLQTETIKQLEKLYTEASVKIQDGSQKVLRSI